MKEHKGKLSFGGYTSNVDGRGVRFELTDESSRVIVLDIRMGPEAFGMAMSGHGDQPCVFRLVGVKYVGKTQEHKTVAIFVPAAIERAKGAHTYDKQGNHDYSAAEKFLKPYEVDGWTSWPREIHNRHNIIDEKEALKMGAAKGKGAGNYYRLDFHRYV